MGQTFESWIDAAEQAAVTRMSDERGVLREVIARQGRTLIQYDAHPELDANHDTYLTTRTLLAEDDPLLGRVTNHLDLYRWGLEVGSVQRLGTETYDGRPALKVRAFPGQDEHLAYLDPETLYPIAILVTDGEPYAVSYPVIETVARAAVPAEALAFDPPDADYDEQYRRLAKDDLASFDAYPVLNLGPEYKGYALEIVEHYLPKRLPPEAIKPERVVSVYDQRDAEGYVTGQMQVITQAPLTTDERAARREHANQAADVATNPVVLPSGERALLSSDGTTLTLDRPEVFVTISAADQETAIAAATALGPAVAAPSAVSPPVIWAGSSS